jgi:rod shape-determining protein MreC
MKKTLHRLMAVLPWITALAVVFYIISLNFKTTERMDFFQRVVVETIGPISKGLRVTSDALTGFFSGFTMLRQTHQDNEALREQLAQYEKQLTEYREAYLENLRLRRLLDFKTTIQAEGLPAQVVLHDPAGWFQTVIVDKGVEDGVKPEMPVLNDEGVVGRILDVSDRYARVLLITDPANAVDGMVQRNRIRGILSGRDAGTCVLKYVRSIFDVEMGDLIITSGKDGIYPKGLRLGRVRAVFKDPMGLFQTVEVEPLVRLNAIEEVMILKRSLSLPKD